MTLESSFNVAYSKYTIGRPVGIMKDDDTFDEPTDHRHFVPASEQSTHGYAVRTTVVLFYVDGAVALHFLDSRAFILPFL